MWHSCHGLPGSAELDPHVLAFGVRAGAPGVEAAQARWRAISGAHLVALVRAGARFENGVLVERDELAA
ncbi:MULTISPECIES: hypothetical protein [Streptomyces]|uniref:Uncharacterized protein n=1 Tax=Streptomyces celluloflavus TaxID=58344 RepID=A0ABW7R802_9ACTN|nr:hypothetical protein [Streptomyces kasugaensis]WSK17816.1 hypothetical protein OG717_15205 [Streptomyces celluloflavus]